MATEPRPPGLPRRIPDAWWKWLKLPGRFHVRKPAKFWVWRRWKLTGKLPALTKRQKIVKWALWGVAHSGEFRYSEGPDRAGWLTARPHDKLPMTTDCSGFATFCYFMADADDPNGLSYKSLGFTGTMLDHAQKVGTVTEDVASARPGDLIVIGPGTGLHVVVCIKGGPNPLCVSHGSQPVIQELLSADPRTPKRVCRSL